MLPTEVLVDVGECLQRRDIDSLQISNARLHSVTCRYFCDRPLRTISLLVTNNTDGLRLCIASAGCNRRAHTSEDLVPLLRQSFLVEASFKAKFDSQVFNVLLPFKDVFRTATVNLPTDFKNDSLIERALSELFFCHEIVALAHRPTPSYNWQGVCRMRGFFTLPCVRSCSKLNLLKDVDVRGLTYDDVITWLNSGSKLEVKELQCFSKFFDGEFAEFLEQLKQSFKASSTPCRFKLTVFEDVHYPEEAYDSSTTTNRSTGETLRISVMEPRTYDKPHIVVERLRQ